MEEYEEQADVTLSGSKRTRSSGLFSALESAGVANYHDFWLRFVPEDVSIVLGQSDQPATSHMHIRRGAPIQFACVPIRK